VLANAAFGMFASGEIASAAIVASCARRRVLRDQRALTADYPILAVSLRVRPRCRDRHATLFTFDPRSIWSISPTDRSWPVESRRG
jgi:hypothetical protein